MKVTPPPSRSRVRALPSVTTPASTPGSAVPSYSAVSSPRRTYSTRPVSANPGASRRNGRTPSASSSPGSTRTLASRSAVGSGTDGGATSISRVPASWRVQRPVARAPMAPRPRSSAASTSTSVCPSPGGSASRSFAAGVPAVGSRRVPRAASRRPPRRSAGSHRSSRVSTAPTSASPWRKTVEAAPSGAAAMGPPGCEAYASRSSKVAPAVGRAGSELKPATPRSVSRMDCSPVIVPVSAAPSLLASRGANGEAVSGSASAPDRPSRSAVPSASTCSASARSAGSPS